MNLSDTSNKTLSSETSLKNSRDRLVKFIEDVYKRSDSLKQAEANEIKNAIQSKNKNKQAAINALKRSKTLRKEINKLDASKINLEMQVSLLDAKIFSKNDEFLSDRNSKTNNNHKRQQEIIKNPAKLLNDHEASPENAKFEDEYNSTDLVSIFNPPQFSNYLRQPNPDDDFPIDASYDL